MIYLYSLNFKISILFIDLNIRCKNNVIVYMDSFLYYLKLSNIFFIMTLLNYNIAHETLNPNISFRFFYKVSHDKENTIQNIQVLFSFILRSYIEKEKKSRI